MLSLPHLTPSIPSGAREGITTDSSDSTTSWIGSYFDKCSIKSPDKPGAEAILLAEKLDALPNGRQVMLKLTIPDVPDLYLPLVNHERVVRVVALSGGYTRADACKRLAANHGMIASFSRALAENLRHSMSDAVFEGALARAIDEIYLASTVKVS